jgi:hypothetical protein
MVYSRVKNGVIFCTVTDIYNIDISADDFWISHDSETDFSVGDKYPVFNPSNLKPPSSWGATSMDGDPLNFIATTI